MQTLLSACCVTLALTGVAGPIHAASPLEAPGPPISGSDISEGAARRLLGQLAAAPAKVERVCGKTYDRSLMVWITIERRIPMALVATWRLRTANAGRLRGARIFIQ